MRANYDVPVSTGAQCRSVSYTPRGCIHREIACSNGPRPRCCNCADLSLGSQSNGASVLADVGHVLPMQRALNEQTTIASMRRRCHD